MPIVDDAEYNSQLLRLLCSPGDDCGVGRLCAADPNLYDHASELGLNCTDTCYACLHKNLLPPAAEDFVGTALLFAGGVLAGASGIGGGGLNVPILMLALGFIVNEATSISHMMVVGNAIAQNLVNLRRRHPLDASRPLVDFDIPLLLLPAQLGGNALGVMFAPALPSAALIILAAAILMLAASKTLLRGVREFRREMRLIAGGDSPTRSAAPRADPPGPGTSAGASITGSASASAEASAAGHGKVAVTDEEALLGMPTTRREVGPLAKVGALVLFWLAVNADYFGIRYAANGERCTPAALGWTAALLCAVGLACAGGGRMARAGGADARVRGDIAWASTTAMVSAMGLAFLIGVLSGLLGLGGGELMAPLLLYLGMLPRVASATSAFMIVFTSSSNLVQYLVAGVLAPELGYVAWAVCLGFASALVGRMGAIRLVASWDHPSLIVLSLGLLLSLALVLLVVNSFAQGDELTWTFTNFCDLD